MNILFLGDSLIEYYDWSERFPVHKVFNLGMAGESVEGLLSRVVKINEICPKADMVFIMTGINNVAMGDTGFIDFYKVIIEKLRAAYPAARINVCSLLPTFVEFINNESVKGVNVRLRELACKMNVDYMDVYKMFVDNRGRPVKVYLMMDGVHISEAGYDVWSRAVEGVVEKK